MKTKLKANGVVVAIIPHNKDMDVSNERGDEYSMESYIEETIVSNMIFDGVTSRYEITSEDVEEDYNEKVNLTLMEITTIIEILEQKGDIQAQELLKDYICHECGYLTEDEFDTLIDKLEKERDLREEL